MWREEHVCNARRACCKKYAVPILLHVLRPTDVGGKAGVVERFVPISKRFSEVFLVQNNVVWPPPCIPGITKCPEVPGHHYGPCVPQPLLVLPTAVQVSCRRSSGRGAIGTGLPCLPCVINNGVGNERGAALRPVACTRISVRALCTAPRRRLFCSVLFCTTY
jgi:hypothetical protein